MTSKLIAQGAEAKIILSDNIVTKDRIPKTYRLKELDEKIRKRRTKKETKLLEKARKVIFTPKVINVDEKTKKITMEFIQGQKLSEHLDSFKLSKQLSLIRKIGNLTAIIHSNNIIHGDLTTSNMILADKKRYNDIYFIDFGLGFQSSKYEDKAVDIHLFCQALEAKHFKNFQQLRRAFMQGYKPHSKDSKIIFKRLNAVEKRGRYKH